MAVPALDLDAANVAHIDQDSIFAGHATSNCKLGAKISGL